jgi:hypothetical protein
MEQGKWSDPALYRELSEPFASSAELEIAGNQFFEELRELRRKHGVPDVYVSLKAAYLADDGDEVSSLMHAGFGNEAEWETMVAFTLGQVQSNRQERTAKLLRQTGAITVKQR